MCKALLSPKEAVILLIFGEKNKTNNRETTACELKNLYRPEIREEFSLDAASFRERAPESGPGRSSDSTDGLFVRLLQFTGPWQVCSIFLENKLNGSQITQRKGTVLAVALHRTKATADCLAPPLLKSPSGIWSFHFFLGSSANVQCGSQQKEAWGDLKYNGWFLYGQSFKSPKEERMQKK